MYCYTEKTNGWIDKFFQLHSMFHVVPTAPYLLCSVACRWADQPGHVLWAHTEAFLARVVRGPGRLLLQRHHRGQRLTFQTTRSGSLLPHGHFPIWYTNAHPPNTHTTGPTVARQRPHRPLALWLWHGHRVLWNRPAQVLTKLQDTLHMCSPQEGAAFHLHTPPTSWSQNNQGVFLLLPVLVEMSDDGIGQKCRRPEEDRKKRNVWTRSMKNRSKWHRCWETPPHWLRSSAVTTFYLLSHNVRAPPLLLSLVATHTTQPCVILTEPLNALYSHDIDR